MTPRVFSSVKPKAAIYLRVSTQDQSIDSQRAETERAAESRGLEAVVFEDHASGAKFSRAVGVSVGTASAWKTLLQAG